jgi:hypothetical protein
MLSPRGLLVAQRPVYLICTVTETELFAGFWSGVAEAIEAVLTPSPACSGWRRALGASRAMVTVASIHASHMPLRPRPLRGFRATADAGQGDDSEADVSRTRLALGAGLSPAAQRTLKWRQRRSPHFYATDEGR